MRIRGIFKRRVLGALLVVLILSCLSLSVSASDAVLLNDGTENVVVSFDSNGGGTLEPITVTYGEKYGKLPSSAVTGLSGGDSNWYLIDENGTVTETKIKKSTTVEINYDHKLFVKRKVLAPTLKITLEVPGAISNDYQYYVPGDSKRILTATVNNQNTDVLDYTYQWYKDDTVIEGATSAVLTLDGNVSDSGNYTVKVTAVLKDGSSIVVTENTASAEKSQKVKIIHAANALYYDAGDAKDGPSSNYTGGTAATVSKTEPTRDGFIFNGWNTKADGTGEKYSGGDTYTFENDNGNGGCEVTLYAQWIEVYQVYVGGVQITEANKDDVFGDGTVSYNAKTNTLTLNNYSYEGVGYQYASETADMSAAIYSKASINIELIGSSTVNNTFADSNENNHSIGVGAAEGIIFTGDGNLNLFGDRAVQTNGTVTVDGCALELQAAEDGIVADNVIIKNGAYVDISAINDGIYAYGNISVTDSEVSVDAAGNGLYSGNGKVIIDSTETKLSDYGLWLDGTQVTVNADGSYGIFAFDGLEIDEKLTVSVPEQSSIGELTEDGYTYHTVVKDDAAAKDIVIEPLGCFVTVVGLKNEMKALVPAGKSLNDTYCDRYGINDFSELLDTDKEGFTFGGWYTDENCTEGKEFDFASALSADVAIYAKWIPATTDEDNGNEDENTSDIPQTPEKPPASNPSQSETGDNDSETESDNTSDSSQNPQKPETTDTSDEKDSPQTDDNSNLRLWLVLMLLSGGGIIALTVYDSIDRRGHVVR